MIKEINKAGKEHYLDATPQTPFSEFHFHTAPMTDPDDAQYALHTNLGSLTVLDRMTGFGWRDTETGFRDPDGKFWLASGNCDVRQSNSQTIQDAIDWVKELSNTCIGQ